MHLLTGKNAAIKKKGEMPIARNSFIQMSKLTNVKGRITYISSRAKQENLYAVYETTERQFWRELPKYNQEEFKKWCGIKKLTAYSQGFHNKTKRIRRYSKWHVNMTMNTKYRQ